VQSELSTLGFPVIAISADRPARLVKSLEEQDLGFTLYSDSSLTAARAFGIVWRLTDAEVAQYQGYGIDLEAASGYNHHQLPVPSVFLVDAGGTIRWVYSNPDHRVRPDNPTLLEAARSLTSNSPD
jgi:peroxiredoxin